MAKETSKEVIERMKKENEELDKQKEELDKKVENLLKYFTYYNDIVEEIGKMFVEYEINEHVICYQTLENYEDITDTELNINYVVKVLYNDNTFQFSAENLKDENTKFKVTIKDNKENTKAEYTLNGLEDIKCDVIKWLISM